MRDNNQDMRQTALSKSLSTALLNHQISELEAQVQSAIQLTDAEKAILGEDVTGPTKPGGIVVTAAQLRPAGQQSRPEATGRLEALKVGRIDDEVVDERLAVMTHAEDFDFSDIAEEDDESWRVIVLDASVLIWALRSVRRIVGKGWEVIVPLETITTLDLLKKGSSHRATGARAATRYIEHAVRQHKPLSSDPSISIQARTHYKRGRGLRLQRENETVPLSGLTDLPVPMEDVPRWAGSILGCAGYFARINAAEAGEYNSHNDGLALSAGLERATLYVANLPLKVEILDEERDKYADRGEGHEIISEAGRFELSVEVVRDEELEDIAFGEDGRMGGRGRGRGRGGSDRAGSGERGRGRGRARGGVTVSGQREKEEPVQEVKILLRRPQAAQAGSVGGSGGEEGDNALESGGEFGRSHTHTHKSANSPGTATSHLPPPQMHAQTKPPALLKRETPAAAANGSHELAFRMLSKDDAKVPPPSAAPRVQRRENDAERNGHGRGRGDHETHFVLLKRPEPKGDDSVRGANGSGHGSGRRDEDTRERTASSARGKGRGRGGKAVQGHGRRRGGSVSTDDSSSVMSSEAPTTGRRGGRDRSQQQHNDRQRQNSRLQHDRTSGERSRQGVKEGSTEGTKETKSKPPAIKLLQRALAGGSEQGPVISPSPMTAPPPPPIAPSVPPATSTSVARPVPLTASIAAPATAAVPPAAQAFSPPSFLSHANTDSGSWQPPPEFKPREFQLANPAPGAHLAPGGQATPPQQRQSFGHNGPLHAFGRPPRPPSAFVSHHPPHDFRPHGVRPGSNGPQSRHTSMQHVNGSARAPEQAPTGPRNGHGNMHGRQHQHQHQPVHAKGGQDEVSIAPGWYDSGFGGVPSRFPTDIAAPVNMRSSSGNIRNGRQQVNGVGASARDKQKRGEAKGMEREKEKQAPPKPKVKRQPGSGPAGRGAFKAPVGSYKDDDDGAG